MAADVSQAHIATLQGMAIFGAVRAEILASLLEAAKVVQRAPGELFVEQGESGQSAFVLERGEVEILREHDGKQHRLRTLGAGDCFGEVALLDFGPRSASVRALSDCQALELTAMELLRVALRDPEQFAVIYMNLGRELSRRLRNADERLFAARFAGSDVADGWGFGSS